MRPGVPWNVKGIEAEAREAAQLAARRAGVSLGEYLTQLIMTEGGPGRGPQSYAQGYPQPYQPGDGTYGPQPQLQYQPQPAMRYPHAVPQAQPQGYAQGSTAPRYEQQHHYQAAQNGAQFDSLRNGEFAVVAHGLRDLADRLENSERRAQTAIATVNQSVAAMQDRIDATERMKQLADVAFTSAADALAQSARDQAGAFESLENTVRSVQKRMNEIESGNAQWPSKDAMGKLETALGQLQKRLGELETHRPDGAQKDSFDRLEATLGQLQKRLGEMEKAKTEFPAKDALQRLERWINDVRHDVADSEKRSREDISQLAKFMRELGTRVDTTERAVAQSGGGKLNEGVAARLDALEARSASMFDEMRNQLSQIDGRLAQTAQARNGAQSEAFVALKQTVDHLHDRVEQNAAAASKGGVSPDAFAALKRSVDSLSSAFDGLTERLDMMSDPAGGAMSGSIGAIGSTLETLTTKIEESERRAADSVSTVSNALKSISKRLDDSDKSNSQALQTITRRLDDADRTQSASSRTVEDSFKSLNERLEAADKKHKEAIGGLRLTVDGLVAKAAADAIPLPQQHTGRHSTAPSALDTPPYSPPPELPPLSSTTARALSGMTAPQPAYPEPAKPEGGGYSVSALQTIMAGTLSTPEPTNEMPNFQTDGFQPAGAEEDDELGYQSRKGGGVDFLEQARRAAKAAAQAEADRPPTRRGKAPPAAAQYKDEGGGRKLGKLAVISVAGLAVVAGVIALLFTFPSGRDDVNRPAPVDSIGEVLNGKPSGQPPAASPGSQTNTEFAPPSAADGVAVGATNSVTVEPNGLGAPTAGTQPPSFTAGTSALPGTPVEEDLAKLEAGSMRGDKAAQFNLAIKYAEGRGVVKDDAKAISLLTKAAEQGLAMAQYRLGALYERGLGAPKDMAQAKAWYERAAKGGNRKAMHNLAVLYADGAGVGQNLPEAARWFRQGAEYGLADSQYNLGILLERGMGVEKSAREAAKWYAIAASQGDTGAVERLEALKRSMSTADVALALEAARQFKPKPPIAEANEQPVFAG